jgi:hypothetical protein
MNPLINDGFLDVRIRSADCPGLTCSPMKTPAYTPQRWKW